jgi:hypothetical protein
MEAVMVSMRALIVVILVAGTLGGCKKSAYVRVSPDEGFTQLQGAELVVKRDLLVPPGQARVFVQGGRATAGGFDRYLAHCAFEVQRVSLDGFTINVGTFRVIQVQGSMQQVVMARPLLLASRQMLSAIGGTGGSTYHQGYHFWLASETQPEVRRMSCYGVYAEPPELEPPSLQEIAQVLGDVAEIRR